MFCVELAIPVDLGVIKFKDAVAFCYLDLKIVNTGEHLILERSKLRVGADIVDFVDDSLDVRVLVEKDLCDYLLVRYVSVSEVQMCCNW